MSEHENTPSTTSDAPAAFTIEAGSIGTRITMPARDLGSWKRPFVFTWLASVIALAGLVAVAQFVESNPVPEFVPTIALLATVFFTAMWFGFVKGGADVFVGSNTVTFTRRFGFVKRCRSIARDNRDALEIVESRFSVQRKDPDSPKFASIKGTPIGAESDKPQRLVGSYPRPVLDGLLDHIDEAFTAERAESSAPDSFEGVTSERPDSARVLFEENSDGFTMRFPARGLFKASNGLVIPGALIVFSSLYLWFAGVPLLDAWAANGLGQALRFAWWGWTLCGGAIIYTAVRMGLRKAILDVDSHSMIITEREIYGMRQRDWTKDEIVDLRAARTGHKVMMRRLASLQLSLKTGETIDLLTGRDGNDLAWVAYEIHKAFGVDTHGVAHADESVEPTALAEPAAQDDEAFAPTSSPEPAEASFMPTASTERPETNETDDAAWTKPGDLKIDLGDDVQAAEPVPAETHSSPQAGAHASEFNALTDGLPDDVDEVTWVDPTSLDLDLDLDATSLDDADIDALIDSQIDSQNDDDSDQRAA